MRGAMCVYFYIWLILFCFVLLFAVVLQSISFSLLQSIPLDEYATGGQFYYKRTFGFFLACGHSEKCCWEHSCVSFSAFAHSFLLSVNQEQTARSYTQLVCIFDFLELQTNCLQSVVCKLPLHQFLINTLKCLSFLFQPFWQIGSGISVQF